MLKNYFPTLACLKPHVPKTHVPTIYISIFEAAMWGGEIRGYVVEAIYWRCFGTVVLIIELCKWKSLECSIHYWPLLAEANNHSTSQLVRL